MYMYDLGMYVNILNYDLQSLLCQDFSLASTVEICCPYSPWALCPSSRILYSPGSGLRSVFSLGPGNIIISVARNWELTFFSLGTGAGHLFSLGTGLPLHPSNKALIPSADWIHEEISYYWRWLGLLHIKLYYRWTVPYCGDRMDQFSYKSSGHNQVHNGKLSWVEILTCAPRQGM